MGADHVFTIMRVPWGAEAGRKETKWRVRQTDGCSMKRDREDHVGICSVEPFSSLADSTVQPIYSF